MADLSYHDLASTHRLIILTPESVNVQVPLGTQVNPLPTFAIQNLGETVVHIKVNDVSVATYTINPGASVDHVLDLDTTGLSAGETDTTVAIEDTDNADAVIANFGVVFWAQ